MIQLTTIANARVLIVGEGTLVDEIVRNLTSHKQNIHYRASVKSPGADKDPEQFIAFDSNYFKSFDLVLCADQPRTFELALACLRWPDLLPWTDAKRALVHSIVENAFHPQQDSSFRGYLIAAHAAVQFHEVNGRWPSDSVPEDKLNFQGMVPSNQQTELVSQYIDGFLRDGLTSAHQTFAVLAQFVAHDALNLLTGDEQPVNNTNLDEVIKIAVKGL
ncbi:uncharacterized protein BHQ10_005156 [Talaromyces amestolkiae]|uniref:Uncharacterized protein n=1 Tax=Talaromyces amestolkiae TaxID=1196081 RepID=A0A364L037_TALAM|nr:uncharacterized protein BHQ10_005156 [Talaromyces amestolkiae]RAO69144.1 hypothetical protein BHQ10_005156 [Talaromyces amestolkiae]